jgi:hypothetical protein
MGIDVRAWPFPYGTPRDLRKFERATLPNPPLSPFAKRGMKGNFLCVLCAFREILRIRVKLT